MVPTTALDIDVSFELNDNHHTIQPHRIGTTERLNRKQFFSDDGIPSMITIALVHSPMSQPRPVSSFSSTSIQSIGSPPCSPPPSSVESVAAARYAYPMTPPPFSQSKAVYPCRSPLVEVTIQSDDDEIIKYQEVRITGIVYCDSNNSSIRCDVTDESTFLQQQQEQTAIVHDSPYGFLRCAGFVYANDDEEDSIMSINSNDATIDPSDRDYFFGNGEEFLESFESPKGVMEFEEFYSNSSCCNKTSRSRLEFLFDFDSNDGESGCPILPGLTSLAVHREGDLRK
mmetsp:Transcript_5914/g.9845  ORF Transcript_5914/g.9845 Transcript_5914/m.9845 type:complete len:285 (-) Transcript_5914:306-1160(-)|eukprot:CAMPEP_0119007848 /NCGR_PEP_ID=MMETSP1176-20130426/3298_1 /TAXON_ID=265551 /ORGANISM="Synedropsis recta cf, Strain CCMP1620" /LENGTH=284 /DNA_ID=CAMNT_0006960081 /DNA_START=290 /DNA_END=1144 /DNA_ORIENTATION=+